MLLTIQIAVGSVLGYYIVEGIEFIVEKVKSRKSCSIKKNQ